MKGILKRIIPILLLAAMVPLAAAAEELGDYAIDFSAVTIDGTRVTLSTDYAGKLILMDFWATWCEPCMEEVPGLVKAYKDFSKRGVAFLGITLDSPSDLAKVRSTMKAKGMAWPQVFDDGSDIDGEGTIISEAYMVEGIPFPLLIDGDTGLILARDVELRGSSLAESIEKALTSKE